MNYPTVEQMEKNLIAAGYHIYFETSANGAQPCLFVDEPTRVSCIEGGPPDNYAAIIKRAYRKACSRPDLPTPHEPEAKDAE